MMRSTQNNLENELALLQLDINADTTDGAVYERRILQYEYDNMDFHDPNCLYYIDGSNKTYIGDFEIQHPDLFGHRLAYITYDTNTKEFMVLRSMNIRGRNFYVTVNRWKDPQKAMNDLLMILHTSDDNASSVRVHEILVNYIQGVYGIEPAILNIMACTDVSGHTGYASQHMTLKLASFGFDTERRKQRDLDKDIYVVLKNEVALNPKALIVKHFLGLYGIFQKYNLFRDKKYQVDPKTIDLSTEISEILEYHVSMFPQEEAIR